MTKGAAYETSYCRRGLFGGRAYTSKEALRNVKFYYEGAEVKMTYLK